MTILVAEPLLSVAGHVAIRPVARVRRSALGALDQLRGTLSATVRALFTVAVAIVAIEALPGASEVKPAVRTSRTGRLVNAEVVAFRPRSKR